MRKSHRLGKEQARSAAEAIARELQEKLELAYHWQGDDLCFKRSGAQGKICISDHDVSFELSLGLLLRPLKSTIEREVQHYFAKHFGAG